MDVTREVENKVQPLQQRTNEDGYQTPTRQVKDRRPYKILD
jgi:hypothetical protein